MGRKKKEDTPVVETPEVETPEVETPIVEDTPVVETPEVVVPVTEEPKTVPTSTTGKVNNLLLDSSVSIEDKISWCLADAPVDLKNIAMQLEGYHNVMKPGIPIDENKMVRKQYELVNIYRGIFNTESYAEFKSKFDVLNLFFVFYAKSSMAPQRLSRFDYLWKWSDPELHTLLNVSEIVATLAYFPTRANNLKKVNLQYALSSTETIVTEDARNHIVRYYTV